MKVSGHILSQDIMSHISLKNINSNDSNEVKRIKDALCIESKERTLYPQNLSRDDLKKMARYVNNTYVHYSGNCALLSACLHYNIHHRQDMLSSKNTASPTVGLDSANVDKVIFGKELNQSYYLNSIDEVEEEILNRYDINRESSFIIRAENYIVPIIGECGHSFNAIVICEYNKKPYIQFIDAWKTSNILPSLQEIKKHFPSSAGFYIRAYGEKHD
ncbi:T3SS effector cysteine hydrolase SpvD family protein [unidentified bacterial endosymbiont]|uniref:T3SS effector cysteine hydrolase SpvD family protein n=1 Tax=unidentified bacterial endosymbiont TaxID=2355 RepID=UPI00209D57D0|nr:T3SS effector cysteine hydrolase SpvD family protein [unidentified bacterial endosymbiont]